MPVRDWLTAHRSLRTSDVEPLQPLSAFLTLGPDRIMESYAYFDFLKLAEG